MFTKVKLIKVSSILFLFLNFIFLAESQQKKKCETLPKVNKKVEMVIKECENEVKFEILSDAYQIIQEGLKDLSHDHDHYNHHHHLHPDFDFHNGDDHHNEHQPIHSFEQDHHHHYDKDHHYDLQVENNHDHNYHHAQHQSHRRSKRDDNSIFTHPTIISHTDKKIAGCLMKCVFKKYKAADHYGYPTLDGLVELYTEGVHEHGYFMATLRAADNCLKGVSHKYGIRRQMKPEKGESCDVAFDVFDCLSDKITEYCNDQHHP